MRKTNFATILGRVEKDTRIMDSAVAAFFDDLGLSEDPDPKELEEISTLFNEWLLFEHKVTNGVTTLQWYYDTVVCSESKKADKALAEELKVILETNIFQPLELLEVKAGEYVLVKGLCTQHTYKIYDKAFSLGAKSAGLIKGTTFFGRIARVNDRWEFVGGNPHFMPVHVSPRAQKMFFAGQTFDFMGFVKLFTIKPAGTKKGDSLTASLQDVDVEGTRRQLERDFNVLKDKHHMVGSYQGLIDLIYKENYRTNFADFITDSFKYLSLKEDTVGFKTVKKMVDLLFAMWNLYPHKELKGLSPLEMKLHT